MTRYTPLWEQAGSYAASVDRRLIAAIWPTAGCQGCAVTADGTTMNLTVAPGAVVVPSQNATGSTLCVSDANEVVTLAAAPPSGQSRIDVVTCHPRANDLDGGSNNDFIFDKVQGAAGSTPSAPVVPAGQVALFRCTIPGASSALTAAMLTDVRPLPPMAGGHALVCVVHASASWIFGGTVVPAQFNVKDYDPYNCFNTATYTFTAPIAGRYFYNAVVQASIGAGSNGTQTYVYVNGAQYRVGIDKGWAASQAVYPRLTGVLSLNAGDTVTIQNNSDVSCTVQASANWTNWDMAYLGPL